MAGGAAAKRRPGPEDKECSGRGQGQSRGGMARVPHRGLGMAGLAAVWTEKRVWEVSPAWQTGPGVQRPACSLGPWVQSVNNGKLIS